MGACCGKDTLLERRKPLAGDRSNPFAGPEAHHHGSRVAPMSLLLTDTGSMDGRLVHALNEDILPFVQDNCSDVYEPAFHKFVELASSAPTVGQLCPKLPGALLELLEQALLVSLDRARKQRATRVALQHFEESRRISHRRILQVFRGVLRTAHQRLVYGLLEEHAQKQKRQSGRLNNASSSSSSSSSSAAAPPLEQLEGRDLRILDEVLSVVGDALKEAQELREVELTRTVLECVIKHVRATRPDPDSAPKQLLDTLQRHLILCELVSTERAYVETLENLRVFRDKSREATTSRHGGTEDLKRKSTRVVDEHGEDASKRVVSSSFTPAHVDEIFGEVGGCATVWLLLLLPPPLLLLQLLLLLPCRLSALSGFRPLVIQDATTLTIHPTTVWLCFCCRCWCAVLCVPCCVPASVFASFHGAGGAAVRAQLCLPTGRGQGPGELEGGRVLPNRQEAARL